MNSKVFVSGATGNVGREVVKHLLLTGQNVIAATRHGNCPEAHERLSCRAFDFTDSATWDACLEGADRVFLMRPPHISRIKKDMLPFIRYLKSRGVRHVVFLSVQGAENNRFVPHYRVEKYLREFEIPYTFIRPGFFMQNLITTHLSEIRDDNMLFIPAGSGRTNFIDTRDIGEAAARILLDRRYLNSAYTLTGEKSYSYGEVAEMLSGKLRHRISFISPNPLRFITFHLSKGKKLAMTLVMLALYSVVKSGRGDITTGSCTEILEREPLSLEQFITDYSSVFLGKNDAEQG